MDASIGVNCSQCMHVITYSDTLDEWDLHTTSEQPTSHWRETERVYRDKFRPHALSFCETREQARILGVSKNLF
jgi:hypothetical protein